ncbi:hypothetical protein lerEdw1_016804 [Lerista edwardsae]|nr:hypothetical protein lerEdw1_016804 [Lerista edwardsae]
MSNKNSAECDTKSECDCDFYSEYWEEIVTHTNQDLLESDGESDLCVPLHHNSPIGSFKIDKVKSKLSEIALFPGNNQTNITNCYQDRPLLQVRTENTRQVQAELSPEVSDRPSNVYSSEIVSYVCDGSCKGHLCLNTKIPQLIIAENLDKETCYYTINESHATDKQQQKQPLADYPQIAIQNKASQISFLGETGENIPCEYFEQSALPVEVNKTPDRKSIIHYSSESICSKKTTSSQLVKEHLDCSAKSSLKIDSPQTAEQTYVHASSAGLTISLSLDAGIINTIGSLAVDISPSEAKVGKEDSQQHALAFKFSDSEHNNLFKKLRISIIPSISYSGHLDTETQKQNTHFTKQAGLPKTLVDEVSQPLATHVKSPESSSPDIPTVQVPSALKQRSVRQFLPSYKPAHEPQSSYLFIRSVPYYKTVPEAKVQKHQLKAFRPVKSVFTKNKEVQKDKIFRNRPCITSKFNWPSTWAVEPFPSQTVKESVINELDFHPLIWASTTCHCSPLLDLTVDLLSERRYSGTEKLPRVHRKPHKQVVGVKVIPRFSSQYLLNPRSSFEKLQYLFPIRNKNCLKMQSILTSCLGQAEERNKHKSYKGEVYSTLDNSNARGNGLFAPCAPADGRHPITSPLSSSGNCCIQHLPALPPPGERRCSHTPFLQTERETSKLAALCPDCKRRLSNSPYCAHIVNVVQPAEERNIVHSLCMEEPNSGTIQVPCEDLALKKFSVCPCGNVPQHALFPSGDICWSDKKTRASPSINHKASMTALNTMNYPKETFNTVEACCTNCHHCFPTCFGFQNVNRQDASRNQFAKVQFPFENEFPNKNLKDFEEASKAVKKTERKNDRIYMGPDTLQECSPSYTCAVPPRDRTPKYIMYCPKCCSGCQHFGTSKEVCNSYSSKQKMLENCLNRESIFLMDPGLMTRSQCKCSQEISLYHVDQADRHKVNRAILSKREES